MSEEPLAVRIEPESAYTREALRRLVCEPLGMDVDRFLFRLRPRKVFRKAWLGHDLLEAWKAAPALGEETEDVRPKTRGGRRGKSTSRPFTDSELGIAE